MGEHSVFAGGGQIFCQLIVTGTGANLPPVSSSSASHTILATPSIDEAVSPPLGAPWRE